MNVLCTICARKGSKGIKNKNIVNFNKKPLIFETINYANQNNKIITNLVISTDSKKIMSLTRNKVDKIFLRSKYLSSSKAGKIFVIRDLLLKSEEYFNKKFDYIIDLDVTSPLRHKNDLNKAYYKFLKSKAEVLFSVTESRKNPYFNMVLNSKNRGVKLIKPSNFLRRQDAPKVYDMNASIYIWKRKRLLNSNSLFGIKSIIYQMKKESSHDIDSYLDLFITKKIFYEYFKKNKFKK